MSFESPQFSLHSDREVSAPEPKRRRLNLEQKTTNGAGLKQDVLTIAPDMTADTIFACLEEIFANQPNNRIQNINQLIGKLQSLKERLEREKKFRERNEKFRLNKVSTDDEDIEVVEIEPRRKTGLITVIDVDPPTTLPSTSKSYTPTETITIIDQEKVPALVAAPPIASTNSITPNKESREKTVEEQVTVHSTTPVEHEFAKPKLRHHLSDPIRQSTKSPTTNKDQNSNSSNSNAIRDKTPLKATQSLEENRQLLENLRRDKEETQITDEMKQQVLETMYTIIGRDASDERKEHYLRQIRVPVKKNELIIQVENPFLSLKKSPVPSISTPISPSTSIMLPPPIRQNPHKATPPLGNSQIIDMGVVGNNNISLRQRALQFGIVPEAIPLGSSPHSQIPFSQSLSAQPVFMTDPKNPGGIPQLYLATPDGFIPAVSGASWMPALSSQLVSAQTVRGVAPPASTSMMSPPQPIMRKSGLANITPPRKASRKVSFHDDCATVVLDKGKVPPSPLLGVPIRVTKDGTHLIEVPRLQNRWSIVSLALPCTLHIKCKCNNK